MMVLWPKCILENSKKYIGLRPQFKTTTLPTLNSYIVKTEIAESQSLHELNTKVTNEINNNSSSSTTDLDNQNNLKEPIHNKKYKNFKASLKLDPQRATLDLGAFMVAVIGHLQALPGSQEINLTLDVDATIDAGIDEETIRTILEKSRDLKVDNPEIS